MRPEDEATYGITVCESPVATGTEYGVVFDALRDSDGAYDERFVVIDAKSQADAVALADKLRSLLFEHALGRVGVKEIGE